VSSYFSFHVFLPPGIAWAVASALARSGCLALFATHFHELTALADQPCPAAMASTVAGTATATTALALDTAVTLARPPPAAASGCASGLDDGPKGASGVPIGSVQNLHVAALASPSGLTLLYEVRPGPSDRSFGVHVARIARFPQAIIDDADAFVARHEATGHAAASGWAASVEARGGGGGGLPDSARPLKRARAGSDDGGGCGGEEDSAGMAAQAGLQAREILKGLPDLSAMSPAEAIKAVGDAAKAVC
jgi:hypothetical protein